MRKVTACKSCHNPFKIKGGYRFCGNLGCTEYNKRYGGKLNAKTLRNENEKRQKEKKEDVT
jgi:hypothetical protein|tara:strand:- start:315 stop:497 length:183 start_codon:yes stop_codon:yes gene_type:complete